MVDIVRMATASGVRVTVLPRLLEVIGTSVEFDDLGGRVLLGVRGFGLSPSSRLLKRVFDLVVTIALLVILSPLLLAIVLAIKLGSRGPVLFRQTRVGRDGNEFEMLKFRTMERDADARKHELVERNEAAPLFKIADDPRTTGVGRLLRRRSLDELPQLLNVLRGDMSLVGPRPLIREEDRLFSGWQRSRYLVAPGVTGPWQILGLEPRSGERHGHHRLPLLRQLVALAGRQDPGAHRPLRAQPPQRRAPGGPLAGLRGAVLDRCRPATSRQDSSQPSVLAAPADGLCTAPRPQ